MSRINRRLTYYSSIRWNDQLWKLLKASSVCLLQVKEVQEKRKKMLFNATATWGVVPCPITVHYVYIHYIFIYKSIWHVAIWHIATTVPYIYQQVSPYIALGTR